MVQCRKKGSVSIWITVQLTGHIPVFTIMCKCCTEFFRVRGFNAGFPYYTPIKIDDCIQVCAIQESYVTVSIFLLLHEITNIIQKLKVKTVLLWRTWIFVAVLHFVVEFCKRLTFLLRHSHCWIVLVNADSCQLTQSFTRHINTLVLTDMTTIVTENTLQVLD